MSNQRLLKHTLGLMLVVLITAGCGGGQAEPTATSTPTAQPTSTSVPPTPAIEPSDQGKLESRPVTLLAIGREDNNYKEFAAHGFREHPEYTCRVGVDCSTEAFPEGMYRAFSGAWAGGVKRITITLTLDQDYSELVLRLVRGGAETSVVTVDGQQTYLVTNTMLGSNDGYVVGAYDLMLGALKKSTHTIQLTVADDGKGNDQYEWDALALFAR